MESKGFNDFGNNSGFRRVEIISDAPPPLPTDYIHNTLVLEIANNFPFVQWLMYRHKEKILKKIDLVERDWFNFLTLNKISILDYEKNQTDKFITEHYKKEK